VRGGGHEPDDCESDENSVERVASSESGAGKAETETEAKEEVSVHA